MSTGVFSRVSSSQREGVRSRARRAAWPLLLACFTALGTAQAASPTVSYLHPHGGQRGTEVDVVFYGDRLGDFKEIFFYEPGITVLKLEEATKNTAVRARFKIAPDCPLGEHNLRLRTATGTAELRTFYVGPFPSVPEKEPNSEFSAPQKVAMNATVEGTIENEDVDYYLVEAKKGERISVEVEATRLGFTLFDPYVAILDMGRFELASCDDSDLLLQDAFASAIAPKDGTYVIQVRETSNGGNGNCHYRLHVGNFSRPSTVFPLGGKTGEELTVKFLGDVQGPFDQKIKLPDLAMKKFPAFPVSGPHLTPSPNWIRVSPFPNMLEVEPNDALDKATATALPLPVAFNGVIEKRGDVDWFKFKAGKGQVFDIHCYARRLRSGLDSVVTVHDLKGNQIAGNDDSGGPDSYMRYQFPADGEYLLRVTDHLSKGRPDFTYRVEFTPVQPSLALYIPAVSQSSQERQTIPVPRGNRYATLIAATRSDFGGELVLSSPNLPPGVTLNCENMAANMTLVPVVFEAKPDAPFGSSLAQLIGKHVDPKTNIVGGFQQTVDLVTAPPNITVYYTSTVDRMAVSVTDEVPFKVSIVEPKVPLVQSGSMNLKVVAERKPDFKGPINLYMLFNPPGVGSSYSVTIPEGQNEVLYPINANGGAEVRKWKIAMLAQANVPSGPVWASTQLATLEVAPPFLTMKIDMAAVEQGKAGEVVCKLQQAAPFDGNAKVELLGLPAQVTTQPLEINKDAKEVVFKVQTGAQSPVGQHGSLFCSVTVLKNAEPIVHALGQGGVLRIDAPPPPKKDAPAPAPAPVAAAPAPAPAPAAEPPKRISRLEKLRLEQAERAKAGNAN